MVTKTIKKKKRQVFRVLACRGKRFGWFGVRPSGSSVWFLLKSDAIISFREKARKAAPWGQLVVHKREGNEIQYEWTYGNDPRRSKG